MIFTFYNQLTQSTFVKCTEERVVNNGKAARNVNFEFDNSCATCRNQGALYVFVNQFTAFNIYFVEDFANNVERRHQVRTTVTYVHTYGFTYFGFQRVIAGNGTNVTVKYYVICIFTDGFVHVKRLQARLSVFAFGVEVTLNDVELFIYFWQTFFRFNQNQTIHTVANVHAYWGNSAVIDVQAGLQCFPTESRSAARCSKCSCSATASAGRSMEIDVMRYSRIWVVGEFYFHGVTFAHTNHLTWNVTVECPVSVINTISHFHGFFDGFHFYFNQGGVIAVNCWWNFRSMGHNCIDNRQLINRNIGFDSLRSCTGSSRGRRSCNRSFLCSRFLCCLLLTVTGR